MNDHAILLDDCPAAEQPIAVIGAGTMGAGIAQVAAAAGHPVRLLDVRLGAAQAAIDGICEALAALVDKGRLDAAVRDATLARLRVAEKLADYADAALVVEVIVEDLAAKRRLLAELDGIVAPNAVLASNTSSISITAIAAGLRRPERVVGMHFFNPVPRLALVEVVSGADAALAVAQAVAALAQRWGKTPVHAGSTPGFIVNRIARPYYAEVLALLHERMATPAQLDALARGAGFRLGPCELIELIGHDVNAAVTQSVFDANFGDRRSAPSLVQRALVDGGRLGRKVGGMVRADRRLRPVAVCRCAGAEPRRAWHRIRSRHRRDRLGRPASRRPGTALVRRPQRGADGRRGRLRRPGGVRLAGRRGTRRLARPGVRRQRVARGPSRRRRRCCPPPAGSRSRSPMRRACGPRAPCRCWSTRWPTRCSKASATKLAPNWR